VHSRQRPPVIAHAVVASEFYFRERNSMSNRRDFLNNFAHLALVPALMRAASVRPKLLIVVAHPDDEYTVAATTYRMVRELGWVADQVVITNGEAGYRYAALAETVYGTKLVQETEGRAHLPAIRKEEVLRAGKILGVRRHYFLDQRDLGFTANAAEADASNWDHVRIAHFLSGLVVHERYDAILTLLPTRETHGHHRAATILTLEAVSRMSDGERPLVFGAEADSDDEGTRQFSGIPTAPLTATVDDQPAIVFDRNASFGYHNALNYQIVVNWVIAEHKSQGLFQTDTGKHEFERLWLFKVSGDDARSRSGRLRDELLGKASRAADR
jgi:LmbE family N-acetylglucosaminyl deacetylase